MTAKRNRDLAEYRRKRDFRRTAEPAPGKTRRGKRSRIFVVQLHHARRRHYDFRLEIDGVLMSWAVPKGPSLDPRVKRLAVEVEDHPLDYAGFEGDIPAGNYGAGHVDIFDRGTWSSAGDIDRAAAKGHLEFELCGQKLRGAWHLIRTHRKLRQPEWLLIKAEDGYTAATEADDLIDMTQQPVKAQEGRGAKGPLRRIAEKVASLVGAKKARMASGAFAPQLARLADAPPAGGDWLHEVKWDGYRLLATIAGARPTLWSRNALEWTSRLPGIVQALAELGLETAQLDGELIVLRDGRSDFNALQAVLSGERAEPLTYVVFDVIHLQDYALAKCPLVERKEILRAILKLASRRG